jgi:hypothetical protein
MNVNHHEKARRRVRARALALKQASSGFGSLVKEPAMPSLHATVLSCAASALACAALGCATPDGGRGAYEQALAQWQGASEDTLRARWGTPAAEEAAGSGKWLTYVVRGGLTPPPTMSLSIGGFGFGGGHTAVGGGVGVTAPVGAASPITCTTRFLVENGKVTTWNFEGPCCGGAG